MAKVLRMSDFRPPQKAAPEPVSERDSKPAYFCMRCDTDRFKLYPTGVVRCANCSAIMRNISFSDSRRATRGK